MYCLRCGYKNEENAKICKNCNTSIIETQDRYNYGTNSCSDQQDYRYRYSYGTNPPKNKTNTCDDQLDYRYKYSYGTNPPSTNYNTSDNQYNYSEKYLYQDTKYDESMDITNDLIAGDEKYFKAYIGPSFNYIIKSKFSFSTLLFGPFYFFAKKMFAYSLLWFFALAVIAYYKPDLVEISYILINIFMATKFKRIYIGFVDKQVEKIKLQSLDLTTAEMIKKCETKGQNKKVVSNKTQQPKKTAVAFIIIFIILCSVLPSIIEYIEYFIKEIPYQDIIKNNNLKYEIPEGFESYYKTDLKEEYMYNSPYGQAEIIIDKYINVTQYHNDIASFTKEKKYIPIEASYNTTLINDKVWVTINFDNSTYYGIIVDEIGYIITTKIYHDPNRECSILLDNFINSLRIT